MDKVELDERVLFEMYDDTLRVEEIACATGEVEIEMTPEKWLDLKAFVDAQELKARRRHTVTELKEKEQPWKTLTCDSCFEREKCEYSYDYVNTDGYCWRISKMRKKHYMIPFFEGQHTDSLDESFHFLALLIDQLEDNPEKSAGLRKLLEAKDCIVRARLWNERHKKDDQL